MVAVTAAAPNLPEPRTCCVAGALPPVCDVGLMCPRSTIQGVNIMAFCKEYNAQTSKMVGEIIPVEITVYEVREHPEAALVAAAEVAAQHAGTDGARGGVAGGAGAAAGAWPGAAWA